MYPHSRGLLRRHWGNPWWRHEMENLPRYWPFVRGIHWSPVNFSNKGHWRGALVFSLICAWINGSINNGEAVDLIHHCAHYDSTVMPLIARFMGSTWGPPEFCRPQIGSMLAPWTLLSGYDVFNASKMQIVLNSKFIFIELQRLITNDYKQRKVTRLIYTWVVLI